MKAILVLLATVAFFISPFLSPEFGGFDPDRYPIPQNKPPVQPAGYAFAIWGVIYLALLAHAVLGLFKYRNDNEWEKGRLSLFVSLGVGAFWLPVALISPLWATVMIWVMLISALMALYSFEHAQPSWISRWPIALYAGWLSAASFVSIGLFLAGFGYMEEIPAAIVALGLATLFAIFNQMALRQIAYAIPIAWGFAAIAVANFKSNDLVAILAGIAALIIALFALSHLSKKA